MSETRAGWEVGLWLLVAGANSAVADGGEVCATARSERLDAVSTIGLLAVGLPERLAALPAAAAAMWNEAPCPASDRPRFVLGEGERTLLVRWIDGASDSGTGVCGAFAGREVRLYAFARDPFDGALRRCGDLARLAEVLAHELGHALGLLDQRAPACGDRIMGQLVRRVATGIAPRRVHVEECAAAGLHFLTMAERLESTRAAGIQLAASGRGPWSTALAP